MERAAPGHTFVGRHAEGVEGVLRLKGSPVSAFVGSTVNGVATKKGESLSVRGRRGGFGQEPGGEEVVPFEAKDAFVKVLDHWTSRIMLNTVLRRGRATQPAKVAREEALVAAAG